MNISDVETFLELVKKRNITKTAEKLFVSQPTVSHRIRMLEEELGVTLLFRKQGYKKVELTAKGEAFIPIAERWLVLMHETLSLQQTGDYVHLKIGCTNSLNATVLVDLFRQILRSPDINLTMCISSHYSHEIYDLLQNHSVDVGFVFHYLNYKHIISEAILNEDMCLVQEEQSAIKKDRIFLSELDYRDEISYIWDNNYQIWHEQMILKGRLPFIEVDGYDLFAGLLQDRKKWAICPVSIAERLKYHHIPIFVSEIADVQKPPKRTTYIITNKDMTETKRKAVEEFKETMKAFFKEHGWIQEK